MNDALTRIGDCLNVAHGTKSLREAQEAATEMYELARAALRSDSPVSAVEEEAYKRGWAAGYTKVHGPPPGSAEVVYGCSDCGIRAFASKGIWNEHRDRFHRPASTGGERDEPDRDMAAPAVTEAALPRHEPSREAGLGGIPEGAVPVEVIGGHQKRDGLWWAKLRADEPVMPDSYVLLPRQVEGDDNPKENGGTS